MWHMDAKAHSLLTWMHNLDTLANLDKSGVCNPANLDKADTSGHDHSKRTIPIWTAANHMCSLWVIYQGLCYLQETWQGREWIDSEGIQECTCQMHWTNVRVLMYTPRGLARGENKQIFYEVDTDYSGWISECEFCEYYVFIYRKAQQLGHCQAFGTTHRYLA